MTIKQILFWLPMILIAFANAMLRQVFFITSMSELKAHQLSTITLMIFCFLYVWYISPFMHIYNVKQALLIGFVWMLLTVVFEFSIGRLTNKSWSYLLDNYNITMGHIWPLFLLWLLILPYLCFQFFNKNI